MKNVADAVYHISENPDSCQYNIIALESPN